MGGDMEKAKVLELVRPKKIIHGAKQEILKDEVRVK